MATGNIPAGNPFGRHVIDPRKQVLIYLWCMANQETTRLVADRFNVKFSSVTRVMHRVTKSLLAIRDQHIKWPNGNIQSLSVIFCNPSTFLVYRFIFLCKTAW